MIGDRDSTTRRLITEEPDQSAACYDNEAAAVFSDGSNQANHHQRAVVAARTLTEVANSGHVVKADHAASVGTKKKSRRRRPPPTASSQLAQMIPLKNRAAPDLIDNKDARNRATLCVQVHRCQSLRLLVGACLRRDARAVTGSVIHVHLVDATSGRRLRRSSAACEQLSDPSSGGKMEVPVMISDAATSLDQGAAPVWEQTLRWRESLQYLCDWNRRTVLLFEIVATKKPSNSRTLAWAFLRLLAGNGRVHLGRRLKLQLFEPPSDTSQQPLSDVANWHRHAARIKLPAVLHVTPAAHNPAGEARKNDGRDSTLPREKHPPQREIALQINDDSKYTRITGQPLLLPDFTSHRLAVDTSGASAVQFSHDGRLLAAATVVDVARRPHWRLTVWHVASSAVLHDLDGHTAVVRRVLWMDVSEQARGSPSSSPQSLLVSASEDWTVMVWLLSSSGGSVRRQMLPHPGPVLDVAVCGRELIATVCRDGAVRLWTVHQQQQQGSNALSAQLHHELIADAGDDLPCCVCLASGGCRMYVGHKGAFVHEWTYSQQADSPRQSDDAHKPAGQWTMTRKVCLVPPTSTCRTAAASHIQLTNCGDRLLLQMVDGSVLLADCRKLRVRHTLTGHLHCSSRLLRGDISACDTYFVSGAEDGCVHVWRLDGGQRVAAYTGVAHGRPVMAVHVDPRYHRLALCAVHNASVSVTVLSYAGRQADQQLGMTLYDQPPQHPPPPPRQTTAPIPLVAKAEDMQRESSMEGIDNDADARLTTVLRRLDQVIAEARRSCDAGETRTTSSPRGVQQQ